MWELAGGLSRLGHEVAVFAIPYTLENKRKVAPASLYQDGVRYHENLVSLIDADVVYSMYHPFSRLTYVTRAPIIASFHSLLWFTKDRSGYGMVPRLAGWLSDTVLPREINYFEAVHVHYDSVRRQIENRAPSHPPIYVIEHFINTEVFHPGAEKNERFTAVFVGRPVWQKGFDLFEKLTLDLSRLGIRFLYVGGGSPLSSIESIGFVLGERQLASILSDAHLLVAPSRVAEAGKSVIEALSSGTPVVTSSRFDWPLNECEGVLVAGDYDEIRRQVLETFRKWKHGEYQTLSSCARKCAVSSYSYESTIRRYESMLRQIANRGRNRVDPSFG